MGRRLLGSLVVASFLLAAAPALAQARPATPELIQRAEDAGRLDRSRADLLRVYAIAAPRRLPAAFRSDAPWDGTLTLLHVRRDLPKLREAERREIKALLAAQAAASPSCDTESNNQANVHDTSHFHITYDTVQAGLTVTHYSTSLEQAWRTEVDSFGWAAPPVSPDPLPGNRYHVRIDRLGPGLYGFVSPNGDHAGFVGNNPNTPWNEGDAFASCMVLNEDFSDFPSSPQASLDSTTAHEFNHSIQFGLGGLTGSNTPDDVFAEGGATWMEDEVQDAANDNYNYLWPIFTESLGAYNPNLAPYPYWITFRGLTERFGTGVADGGEQVMQDFWELTSRNEASNQDALALALQARGTTLADAFHAYAVAVRFNRSCNGGYVYPYCFEEGPGYLAAAGTTANQTSIASVGGSAAASVKDNYTLAWVGLPASAGEYSVTLANTSGGGQLRATAACDTGSGLRLSPLSQVAAAGQSATLPSFSPAGCLARVLVVTNQSQTAPNPATSASRSFTVSTGAPSPTHTLSVMRTGSGNGTVTSNPAGINCGDDCSESYAGGTSVTLTATPAAGSSFAGWSGPCSGTQACTVTMNQSASVGATFSLLGGPGIGGDDLVAPAISRLALSPARFRAARGGPALSATVGTRVSLTLSEAATVTFRVSRLVPGRRVGGRCVRPTAMNRRAPRCVRSVRLRGRIARQLSAGTSRLRYRGRLAGRRLRPGRYLLRVQARDAAGNRSAVRRASFRIVR